MTTLYELAAEYRNIEERLEELEETSGDDVLDSALWDLLRCVEEDATIKAANIVRWIENEQARAESLANEIRTLQDKKRSAENKAKNLKKFLGDFMKASGIPKLDAGIRKLSFRKGSKSLEIDVSQVHNWPADIYDAAIASGAVVETIEVKKPKLKELPNYLSLPGVTEVTGEDSLQIR